MLRRSTGLKRTPLKRTPLKQGPAKLKKKKPDEKDINERKAQQETDKAFYQKIWDSRTHVCEVHEGYHFLGYAWRNYMFDHLLEKSTHPQLRYNESNIVLICGDCHACKTVGHPRPKHIELIEHAKVLLLT